MARLVIGTNKTATTPALVKEVGIVPTGTINITTNGTTDVTQYASADVSVTPLLCMQFRNENGLLQLPNTVIDLTGVNDISSNCLNGLYKTITTFNNCAVSFDSITALSYMSCMKEMFMQSKGITSFSMDNVVTLSGGFCMENIFRDAQTLSSVSMNKLEVISGTSALSYAFSGTPVTSFDFSSLRQISGTNGAYIMFYNCKSLTSGSFPSLSVLTGDSALYFAFGGCTSLQSLSFPALKSDSFGNKTNQFNSMLYGVTGCTVHFPSNLQSVIGSWNDVVNGFGGTNTTVSFDLPATE